MFDIEAPGVAEVGTLAVTEPLVVTRPCGVGGPYGVCVSCDEGGRVVARGGLAAGGW